MAGRSSDTWGELITGRNGYTKKRKDLTGFVSIDSYYIPK